MLAIAAGIERRSQHPLALAIVRYADAQGLTPSEVQDFRSLTGAGASAQFDGSTVYVGKPDFFQKELGVSLDPVKGEVERLQSEGKTVVFVGDGQAVWGLVAIRDNVRPNAKQAMQALHDAGVDRVVMLTGDNERTAQAIAREVGIDEVYANLTPEDKARKVRELSARYGHLAMVGDGVNDAPALAEATVGIAMRAAGSDVALETADVALMADDLTHLPFAVGLSRKTSRIIRQNLWFSLGMVAFLIPATVLGLQMGAAVLFHEGSTLLVVFNALRLLKYCAS